MHFSVGMDFPEDEWTAETIGVRLCPITNK
jgi:hypothetical protein